MDKFCGYCGKALESGEPCGCRAADSGMVQEPVTKAEPHPAAQQAWQAPAPQQPAAFVPQAGEAPSSYPPQPGYQPQPAYAPPRQSPLGKFYKSYFTDPVAASDELLREGGKSPYVVGLLSAIVSGLYIVLFCRQLMNAITSFALKSLSAYGASSSAYLANPSLAIYALFGELFDDIDWMLDYTFDITLAQFFSELKLPYGGLLLSGITTAVVGILAVAVVWMLLGAAAKRPTGFAPSLGAVCAASHAGTVVMVLAILVLFVSPYYSLLCVLGAVVTFAVSSGIMLHDRVGGGAKIQYAYGLLFFAGAYLGYLALANLLARQILNISFRGFSLGMVGSDPFWFLNLLSIF